MASRISAGELLDGYDILFDSNTRLAHEACLLWAQDNGNWRKDPIFL